MTSCEHVLSSSAAYVDGDLTAGERATIDVHLAACAACRGAVDAEREGREALVSAREELRERAPDHLRAAVVRLSRQTVAAAGIGRDRQARTVRPLWRRVPLAATLALACAGVVAYGLLSTGSTAIAAQLALDHLKCVRIVGAQPGGTTVAAQTEAFAQRYGWRVRLPAIGSESGFDLLTLRRCLHSHGYLAHAIYRRSDHLVSLFILPRGVQATGVLAIMGERASFWSSSSHTYAVVGARDDAELQAFASLARRTAE